MLLPQLTPYRCYRTRSAESWPTNSRTWRSSVPLAARSLARTGHGHGHAWCATRGRRCAGQARTSPCEIADERAESPPSRPSSATVAVGSSRSTPPACRRATRTGPGRGHRPKRWRLCVFAGDSVVARNASGTPPGRLVWKLAPWPARERGGHGLDEATVPAVSRSLLRLEAWPLQHTTHVSGGLFPPALRLGA